MAKVILSDFITDISLIPWFTALHYRVTLYLIDRQFTQAELCRLLDVKPSNMNRVCKELEREKIIKVISTQGRNKTLTTDTQWRNKQIKGQMSIEDME